MGYKHITIDHKRLDVYCLVRCDWLPEVVTKSRAFKPHITLGHINNLLAFRSFWGQNREHGIVAKRANNSMNFKVNAIKLFKSEPQEVVAIYIPIAIYKFV
jgi:2'-5' RNA ligase